MNTLFSSERIIKLAVVAITLAIFALAPWVSLDSDVRGIFWNSEDAAAGKNADSLSGLDLLQKSDMFHGTHPDLLLVSVIALIVIAVSVILSAFIAPLRLIDPYLRFIAAAVIVLCSAYILYELIAGEVGTSNAFNVQMESGTGDVTLFVIVPSNGEGYVLRAENIGSGFKFAPYDYMGPHIGSVALLVAGLILLATSMVPSPTNIRRELMQVRMARKTPEQRLAEARHIWDTSPRSGRRHAVTDVLLRFMTYEEISKLMSEWDAEEKQKP